jgi:hypothetical protein
MYCVRCGHKNDLRTVGFKAQCEACLEYLHSCVQCALFNSVSERCRSNTTEPVSSRDGFNYCEEYVPNDDPDRSSESRTARSGEDFENLFGGPGD